MLFNRDNEVHLHKAWDNLTVLFINLILVYRISHKSDSAEMRVITFITDKGSEPRKGSSDSTRVIEADPKTLLRALCICLIHSGRSNNSVQVSEEL